MKNDAEEVIRILMDREDYTRGEAEEVLDECRAMAADCCYDPTEVEEIMMEELGLEMDYVFVLL